jgi:tRNA A37 threonylcarbamoyltransferase TsaD
LPEASYASHDGWTGARLKEPLPPVDHLPAHLLSPRVRRQKGLSA